MVTLASALSAAAAAHPAFVPIDPPVALVQADPGRTTFSLTFDRSGWLAALARSVSEFCDVVAFFSPRSPFDLRVRALVPGTPLPFRVAAEVGRDRVAVLGALHLGPMRLVGERSWGESPGVRLALHTTTPALALAAGATLGDVLRPLVAVTWFPRSTPLWGFTLTMAPPDWRLTLGGSW